MPIPLAHPTAILPLRRWCPRYFSFVALVIGSLLPDVAYALNSLSDFSRAVVFIFGSAPRNLICAGDSCDWDNFSHTLAGSIAFCLPLGVVLLAAFISLRAALVVTFPNPHRAVLLPFCSTARPPMWSYIVSLLIGAWLHVGWDSMTSSERWLAHHWNFLHLKVAPIGSTSLPVYTALWLVSSLLGSVAVIVVYLRFLKRNNLHWICLDRSEAWRYALWVAIPVIGIFAALPTALRVAPFQTSLKGLDFFLHRFGKYYFAILVSGSVIVAVVSRLLQRSKSLRSMLIEHPGCSEGRSGRANRPRCNAITADGKPL